jgi:hypothetical protein
MLERAVMLEAQRACAQRGAACLPQRARDGSDVEEAQHPLPLSRRHPSALQSGLKKSDKLGARTDEAGAGSFIMRRNLTELIRSAFSLWAGGISPIRFSKAG